MFLGDLLTPENSYAGLGSLSTTTCHDSHPPVTGLDL
jgi:hypothetical protein